MSRNILISQASISETGGINGTKGDQTGKEVYITNLYDYKLNGKVIPWRVFRCPDSKMAYWIAQNSISIANNNNFGYGQNDRGSSLTACVNAKYEPKNVTTPCNIDCSMMAKAEIVCAYENQDKVPNWNTGTMPQELLKMGFKEIPYNVNTLQEGDILVTSVKAHTVTVCQIRETGSSASTSTAKYPIYRVATAYSWLDPVNGNSDYAGIENRPIYKFMAKWSDGTPISYQVHCGGRWLPTINGYDENNSNTGWGGDGKNPIDAIYIEGCYYKVSTTSSTAYLPTVHSREDYGGTFGKPIDKIMAWA